MKRRWQIRRHLVATPDGQLRWDQAYQALLSWTQPDPRCHPTPQDDCATRLEVNHARGNLCAGLDPTAGAGPNH